MLGIFAVCGLDLQGVEGFSFSMAYLLPGTQVHNRWNSVDLAKPFARLASARGSPREVFIAWLGAERGFRSVSLHGTRKSFSLLGEEPD